MGNSLAKRGLKPGCGEASKKTAAQLKVREMDETVDAKTEFTHAGLVKD